MNCPNCRDKQLKQVDVDGYPQQLDYCSTCEGFWFDSGELEKMLGVSRSELRLPRGASPSLRHCPDCRRRMHTFYYPQTFVQVEMCKKCRGLWLDRNEFEEVETVRSLAKESGVSRKAQPGAPSSGLKGLLLQFVEVNINAFKFWK